MNIKCKLTVATIFLMLFFVGYSPVFGSYAQIQDFSGDVSYLEADAEEWNNVQSELSLSAGDKIKSSKDSWAKLKFRAGHEIRLGPESYMEISSLGEETNIEFLNGELLSKVRELSSNEKYQITTPDSVVSVRGTEFLVNVDENLSETLVRVNVGDVEVEEIITGHKVTVQAGYFSRIKEGDPPTEPREISKLDETDEPQKADDPANEDEADEPEKEEKAEEVLESDILDAEEITEDPSDEIPDEEPKLDDAFTEISGELRNEIRAAVDEINVEVSEAQDIIDETRETDVSTGRSLRDRWGNLVRVEQHIMRPNSKTLQFINITKRDNYKYKGRMNTSDTGARMDSFETKIGFNLDIPEKISGWINFASDIEDSDKDFHPEFMELKLSNQTDQIRMVSDKWLGDDEGLEEPTLWFESGLHEGRWKADTDPPEEFCEGSPIGREPHEDRIELWGISPAFRLVHETSGQEIDDMRIGMEGALINNEGKIIGSSDLSDGNPFDLLKKIAFQASLTFRHAFEPGYILADKDVKENDGNRREALEGFNKASNFFENNFDNIMTPDIVYNIIEELARDIDFDEMESNDN
ncbi:MAG: FecR family protein [Elusimicrobiota bacterium]